MSPTGDSEALLLKQRVPVVRDGTIKENYCICSGSSRFFPRLCSTDIVPGIRAMSLPVFFQLALSPTYIRSFLKLVAMRVVLDHADCRNERSLKRCRPV